MGLFTRGKVWISADRATYLEHDQGTGLTTLYVDGVAVLTASSTSISLLAETLATETITGALTANNLNVNTTARFSGLMTALAKATLNNLEVLTTSLLSGAVTATAINVMTTARLLGNSEIGANVTSLVGFYGVTPTAQPAHTNQSALSTGTVTGVPVTATAITTTGVVAGFQDMAQVTALLTYFNALRTQVDAQGSMLNAMRTALVGVGVIKGSI